VFCWQLSCSFLKRAKNPQNQLISFEFFTGRSRRALDNQNVSTTGAEELSAPEASPQKREKGNRQKKAKV